MSTQVVTNKCTDGKNKNSEEDYGMKSDRNEIQRISQK